jgi:hypothetical protein
MKKFDSIELEIFKNIFVSISEEMGAVLGRTALSPNIKARKDFSCALFNDRGETLPGLPYSGSPGGYAPLRPSSHEGCDVRRGRPCHP